MCLAQGHNTVTQVRLEPEALRSRDKHSTTEPPCEVCVWSLLGNAVLGSWLVLQSDEERAGPEVKLFPCSTHLNTKFILLINVKMPTIVGILTFICRMNTTSES